MRLIRRVVGSWVKQDQAVCRALNLIATPNDLLNFNCEYAAHCALTGKPKSLQLAPALAVLGLTGF